MDEGRNLGWEAGVAWKYLPCGRGGMAGVCVLLLLQLVSRRIATGWTGTVWVGRQGVGGDCSPALLRRDGNREWVFSGSEKAIWGVGARRTLKRGK